MTTLTLNPEQNWRFAENPLTKPIHGSHWRDIICARHHRIERNTASCDTKGVDLNFTSVDLTLSLDDFSKRILEPAMSVLAANIEADALNMYKDVYNSVWNGGAAATYNKALDARVILQRTPAPMTDRTALMNPLDMADIVKIPKPCSMTRRSYLSSTKKATWVVLLVLTGQKTLYYRHSLVAAQMALTWLMVHRKLAQR